MARISRMTRKRLGELLLDEGLLTPEQLEAALELQRREGLWLGEILVRQRLVEEDEITQLIARQYGLPYLDPSQYDIPEEMKQLFPEAALRQYLFVPVDTFGDSILIVFGGEIDSEKVAEIERLCGKRVHMMVGRASDVRLLLSDAFHAEAEELTELGSLLLGQDAPAAEPETE